MNAGIPKVLRTVGIVLVIVGALFKIQHWPWTNVIFIVAWGLTLIAMVGRPLSGQPILHKEGARDLFAFGMLSLIVMRTLHLPGEGFALAVAMVGGIVMLWLDRDSFLPGRGDSGSKPLLFYTALLLVVAGTLFRVLHWPYGNAMLLGGLAVVGFWFFSSMYGGDGEE